MEKNKENMTNASSGEVQRKPLSRKSIAEATKRTDDGINELTESLSELQKSIDTLSGQLNRVEIFVHEFFRWNPTTGSIPNTRVIKSWRATVKDILNVSREVVSNSEKVFKKNS